MAHHDDDLAGRQFQLPDHKHMTGEWTVRTALHHIETLLKEQDRRYEQAFVDLRATLSRSQRTAQLALEKAEAALEARLAGLNEFRQMMEALIATMMPRAEISTLLRVVDEKVDDLKGRQDATMGKSSGLNAAWLFVAAAIGALGTVLGIVALLIGG